MAANTYQLNTQPSKGTKKRKWAQIEDELLVSCMVDLYKKGTHSGNNEKGGFDSGYLSELKKLLKEKLPNSGLKAKPHIESRIKSLKGYWLIVYDMIYGSKTSGFGRDDQKKMVTAEPEVWAAYLESNPKAATYKTKSLWYFDDFTMIYAKDRATGQDAQTAEDVLNEMEQEQGNIAVGNSVESLQDGSEAYSTYEDDTLSTGVGGSSRKKKAKTSDYSSTADSILRAAMILGNDMKEIGKEMSKCMGTELALQEKAQDLFGALKAIDGLNEDEILDALNKIPERPTHMIIFFSLPIEYRHKWVKDFLSKFGSRA